VTIDHNTVITNQGTIVSFYGAPAMGFVYTNNISKHNTYGMIGSGSTPGLATLATYAPDGRITNNILAGGPASKYPAGNYFPTVVQFEAGFVNYAGGDFHLRPEFAALYASTDVRDLGADIDVLERMKASALGGGTAKVPVTVETTSLPHAMLNQPYEAFLTCKRGGATACAWSLLPESQLPAGIKFDATSGKVFGTPTAFGTGKVAVRAFDPKDPGNLDEQTFDLVIDAPALHVTYPNPAQGEIGVPFRLMPAISNAIGALTFELAGALPDGLMLNAVSGAIEGVPTKVGVWTAGVTVRDARGPAPTQTLTITIAPAKLTILPIEPPSGQVGTMYSLNLNAKGGTPPYTWTLNSGTLPTGVLINPSGTISGVLGNTGTFTFGVKVTDGAGASATATASLKIDPVSAPGTDIVLYAANASVIKGTWSVVADATAAGGKRIANADAAAAKLAAPLAAPANYFELTFNADAGVGYRLWMRGKADGNCWANDSVFVQFSDSVDGSGNPVWRIGSSSATVVSLEDCSGCGEQGWGWNDNGYNTAGTLVTFATTGPHTIRIQQREDGIVWDQLVLTAAPGRVVALVAAVRTS